MSRTATGLCAAVLTFGLVAMATPVEAQGLAVGVEGGATFSNFSVSGSTVNLSNRTGLRLAGVVRYGFGLLGLESGLVMAQKGAVEPASVTGLSSDLAFHVNYIEVPLLLTLQIPTGPAPIHPRVFAGPQVGFQNTCSLSASITGVTGSVACDSPTFGTTSLTNSTDFGLVFGGGLDFPLGGPLALTVDGRYDLGLSNINGVSGTGSMKNRSFTVSGGILFAVP
jgi:hypothetical protein